MVTREQAPVAGPDELELERAFDEVRSRIKRANSRQDELETERRRTLDALEALMISNVAVLETDSTSGNAIMAGLLIGIVTGLLLSGVLSMLGV